MWVLALGHPHSSPGSDVHQLSALGEGPRGLGFLIYKRGTVLPLLWGDCESEMR